jgi:tetratricopeptide (TPR) repeat protein
MGSIRFRSVWTFEFLVILAAGISGFSQSRPVAGTSLRSISVESEPDATVWIDGVRYGKTGKTGSLDINTLAPGSHTLRLRADGFKEKTQPLTAVQSGSVKIPLVKTTDEAELAFQEAERIAGGDRDKAVAAYQRAIKLRPTYAEAYLSLARTQSDAGNFDDAQKAVAAARRLRPGLAEASAIQGRIYKDNGEEAKAIAAFKRAITEGKGFQPEAYAGLGLLYKEKAEGSSGDFQAENDNYEEAAKNLKMAIRQLAGAPDSIVIYQLLGLIYERQQKVKDAIAVYEEFLRLFPNSVEATAVQSFIVQLKKDNP